VIAAIQSLSEKRPKKGESGGEGLLPSRARGQQPTLKIRPRTGSGDGSRDVTPKPRLVSSREERATQKTQTGLLKYRDGNARRENMTAGEGKKNLPWKTHSETNRRTTWEVAGKDVFDQEGNLRMSTKGE